MTFRLVFISLFLIFILSKTLQAGAYAEPESQEWILTRRISKMSWQKILATTPEFNFIRAFGPLQKFALVRSKSPLSSLLGKDILALQRNLKYEAYDAVDPEFSQSWGLSNSGQTISGIDSGIIGVDVGAVSAWKIPIANQDLVVAILDTGIDLLHEDLKTNIWKNRLEIESNQSDDDANGFINDVYGWNFVDDNGNVQDDNNHGTAVAGVLGADTKNGKGSRGLLTKGSLMVVKILDQNGMSTTERAVMGIEYAVKNGASVINASWGGTTFDQVLFDTISWANERGVLVVCAAGNEAKDNDTDERPSYPASFQLPNVVSVAAHDNQDRLVSFTNYGKETVHVAAPGIGIYSTVRGGYLWLQGTSFAAPFVAGVAAMLRGQEPLLSPLEVKNRLIQTVVPLHYYVKERLVSGGRVNAFNALKNIVPPKIQAPTKWKKELRSVESLHPYLNDTKQVYEIKQPGAGHVRVHFTNFDLEKQYDQLVLKDNQARPAMTYSGKLGAFWSADVLGDTLRLEFTTDFSNPNWGFAIDAYEFAP